MNLRRRFVVSLALIILTLGVVKVLDEIIKIDQCPAICEQVRAGQRGWWEALLIWHCWCGDEPSTPPKTDGARRPTTK